MGVANYTDTYTYLLYCCKEVHQQQFNGKKTMSFSHSNYYLTNIAF